MNTKEHILIIEDEKLIAYDIEKKVKKQGYKTTIAEDYDQVKQVIQNHDIDLMLVDIMLPGPKDGIEIVEEINENKQIPAIFVTAYDEEEITTRLKKTGPYGYILKPFDEKELMIAVNIAIYRHSIEKKLQEKNLWITSILNTITDVIIVINFDKQITFMNTIAKNIFDTDNQNLEEVIRFYDEDKRPFKSFDIERFKKTNMPIMYHDIFVEYIKQKKIMKATCSLTPLYTQKEKSSGVVISIKKSS